MRKPFLILGLFLSLLGTLHAQGFLPFHDRVESDQKSDELTYAKAVIKSAAGWKLNKLPQVKGFITDAPKYGVAVELTGINMLWFILIEI